MSVVDTPSVRGIDLYFPMAYDQDGGWALAGVQQHDIQGQRKTDSQTSTMWDFV